MSILATESRQRRHAASGFTLLEVLIALSIIGLMTAVAVPALARRLESAFAAADLSQIRSSAELLPVRLATLGMEMRLDAKAQQTILPDGRAPLDLPPAWALETKSPPYIGRGGSCLSGDLVVIELRTQRRWQLKFDAISCQVSMQSLNETRP